MFVHPAFYPTFGDPNAIVDGVPGGPYVKVRHGGTSHGPSVVSTQDNYNVGLGDDVICADTSAGNVTIYLPESVSFLESRRYTVIKTHADNTVTVQVVGGGTINSAGDLSVSWIEQDRSMTFVCGGA